MDTDPRPAPAEAEAAPPPAADPSAVFTAVTIAVAWTLSRQKAELKARVVAEAREHVLRSLPVGCDPDLAAFLAPELVLDWIGRLKNQRYRRLAALPEGPWPPLGPLQQQLFAAVTADKAELTVLRRHYGEGRTLDALVAKKPSDLRKLEAARGRLRERARALTVAAIGVGQEWDPARLDHLLQRVVNLAVPGAPDPLSLLGAEAAAHAKRCPQTARALHLVTHKGLDARLLVKKPDEPLVGEGIAGVLAVLLHPDARRFAARVQRLIGAHAVAIADDAWLIAEDKVSTVTPILAAACLDGAPSRHFLRGALVRDQGRWSHNVLLGPLPLRALDAARSRPWGELDGVGELPLPRPLPPSAVRWWASAGALWLAVAALALFVLRPADAGSMSPVQAQFSVAGGAVALRFDTPDLATVDVLALRDGRWQIVHRSALAAKGVWATGEGDYALSVRGEQAALVSSAAGVASLEALVTEANASARPPEALRTVVRAADPTATVLVSGAASLLTPY